MSLQITIFNSSDEGKGERVKFLKSKTEVLKYLEERYRSDSNQNLTIVFANNSHLADPVFLAKILTYQFKQRISNFSVYYAEKSAIYTITFTIN